MIVCKTQNPLLVLPCIGDSHGHLHVCNMALSVEVSLLERLDHGAVDRLLR